VRATIFVLGAIHFIACRRRHIRAKSGPKSGSVFAVTLTCRGPVFRRASPSPRCTKMSQTCPIRILAHPACSTYREPRLKLPRSLAFDALKSVQFRVYRNRCCSSSVRAVQFQLSCIYSLLSMLPGCVQNRSSSSLAPPLSHRSSARVRITSRAGFIPTFLFPSTMALT
jgi:hypothetical protein